MHQTIQIVTLIWQVKQWQHLTKRELYGILIWGLSYIEFLCFQVCLHTTFGESFFHVPLIDYQLQEYSIEDCDV